MKPLTRRELVKRLRDFGFDGPHSGGKHSFMRKGKSKVRIPNPHKNDVIDIDLLDRIRNQAGVPKKGFRIQLPAAASKKALLERLYKS